MKKIALIVLSIVVIASALAIGITTYQFNYYSPDDEPIDVDEADLSYFIESYEESRTSFISLSNNLIDQFGGSEIISLPVESDADDDLTIDILYIPAQEEKEMLLIQTIGLHGVEGFAGSAVARMFMQEFITADSAKNTGYLFLHAVNPYGFKHSRRTTENNVDLNRNCSHDDTLYQLVNEGYRSVNPLINPTGKANASGLGNRFFHLSAIYLILRESMDSVRQAVLQGQYEFEKGIFFGGKELEPQIEIITPLLSDKLNRYPLAMHIDLHTGYGERGKLHLLQAPIEDEYVKESLEKIFEGYPIDWTDTDDFYEATGDFVTYVGELMEEGLYLSVVFEYGTMDTQNMMGSIKSLHINVLENQGYFFGYSAEKDKEIIKSDYREMYYPSSPEWRAKVINDSRMLYNLALENLEAIKAQDR